MKQLLTLLVLLSLVSSAHADYIRQATETYPGGSTGGVTPSVATNIAANIVQRDVAPWAMAGQPMPSGGGVTTNAVKDIVAGEGYIKASALTGYATEAWVEGKEYVTKDVTNGLESASHASATYAKSVDLTSHTTNTANPHNVTAAQVGLGNVNNTSDADKPISTATQAALDGKQATISDLADIRAGATAGSTAVQPAAISDMATKTWVEGKEYVTKAVTNGLASTSWVEGKGYVTETITNGLASTSWVTDQNYVTESITNGILTAAKDYADQYANQAPDYANVSNLAVTAIQTESDPTVAPATNAVLSLSKEYTDDQIARHSNLSPVWSATDYWALEFWLGYTSSVIGHVSTITNDAGQVISRDTIEYIFGNYADLYAELYDEYSIKHPVIASYACRTPGGTISADGRLTVTSNGVYKCIATDTEGNQSSVEVPIQSSRQEVKERPTYDSDLAGTPRKTINDDAKTIIENATLAGTGTYEGKEYKYWNFFAQPTWAASAAGAAGNVRCIPLGTTVMASAWHYPKNIRWKGTQTVGSTTVTKGEWVHLYTWALTNGFEKAELDTMEIWDIAVIPVSGGPIPLTDLPYLMSEEQMADKYVSLAGLQCWASVQDFAQPINRTFITTFGDSVALLEDYWETSSSMKPWRSDIETAIASRNPTYPIHGGDSGKPIYFKDENGRFILTSHYQGYGGGPKYIKGFHVIKAFVEAHGGQIRELP